MRIFKLFIKLFSLSLKQIFTYRSNMIFDGLMTTIGLAAEILTIGAVFSHIDRLADWDFGASLVLLGTYNVITGIIATFVEPNLNFFGDKVRNGALDDLLLIPVPSLFMASFQTCNPWALFQVFPGGIIMLAGLINVSNGLVLINILAFLYHLFIGLFIAWAYRVIVACIAFWSYSSDLTVLYAAFWQLGRYPSGIYKSGFSRAITFLVPVGLISTYPAYALIHGTTFNMIVISSIAAPGFFILARILWNFSLKSYTSATS